MNENNLPTEFDRFGIYMPPGLKKRLKEVAERENRSMNQQIVHFLTERVVDYWVQAEKKEQGNG